jgi:hypothetical protein
VPAAVEPVTPGVLADDEAGLDVSLGDDEELFGPDEPAGADPFDFRPTPAGLQQELVDLQDELAPELQVYLVEEPIDLQEEYIDLQDPAGSGVEPVDYAAEELTEYPEGPVALQEPIAGPGATVETTLVFEQEQVLPDRDVSMRDDEPVGTPSRPHLVDYGSPPPEDEPGAIGAIVHDHLAGLSAALNGGAAPGPAAEGAAADIVRDAAAALAQGELALEDLLGPAAGGAVRGIVEEAEADGAPPPEIRLDAVVEVDVPVPAGEVLSGVVEDDA